MSTEDLGRPLYEREMRKAAGERSEKDRRGVSLPEALVYALAVAAMLILAWIAWGPRA
ncbi:hypothetical protein HOU02_gp280 [Caulobacter phage CcrBL9]|uniref:Uncharacterized protein n=1 Tax=Caulobacter phage CcrBL9 TaxID=2283270 RepID=A0A385EEJ4_9CAUD|nr:hypothetical protein HOU02_gp280 [Caulobacter phage CcrBL9]AXQ69445.1 hypothetical protein CcrBL9_gp421 [Caulobacter phage CcrBL9]